MSAGRVSPGFSDSGGNQLEGGGGEEGGGGGRDAGADFFCFVFCCWFFFFSDGVRFLVVFVSVPIPDSGWGGMGEGV